MCAQRLVHSQATVSTMFLEHSFSIPVSLTIYLISLSFSSSSGTRWSTAVQERCSMLTKLSITCPGQAGLPITQHATAMVELRELWCRRVAVVNAGSCICQGQGLGTQVGYSSLPLFIACFQSQRPSDSKEQNITTRCLATTVFLHATLPSLDI